jgi:transcriptional regulator with XRE-family HTH domain
MSRRRATFEFPEESGQRLKELRLGAGLSIGELVRRLGGGKGYLSHVSRLERGKLKLPGLVLVADYLRVCRASFVDVVPILDKYTSRPVPIEVTGREQAKALISLMPAPVAAKLDRYDVKTSVARRFDGEPPLEPDKRTMRLRRQAGAWLERDRLDRKLSREVMDSLGVCALVSVRKFVFDYAHKLWSILKKTRPEPGVPIGLHDAGASRVWPWLRSRLWTQAWCRPKV